METLMRFIGEALNLLDGLIEFAFLFAKLVWYVLVLLSVLSIAKDIHTIANVLSKWVGRVITMQDTGFKELMFFVIAGLFVHLAFSRGEWITNESIGRMYC